ncbi:hypothetical protein ACFLSZ_02555 [Candidatus Bipolaricaulota bacterium]
MRLSLYRLLCLSGCAVLLVAALAAAATDPPELAAELEVLRPLLGEWVGEYEGEESSPQILRSWTAILGGQAIHEVRTVAAFAFDAESFFFFDRVTNEVSYIGLTNNGYVTRGSIALEDGALLVLGTQISPDGSETLVRSTLRFADDGTVQDQLFTLQDGTWEAGHSIRYASSTATD